MGRQIKRIRLNRESTLQKKKWFLNLECALTYVSVTNSLSGGRLSYSLKPALRPSSKALFVRNQPSVT